MQKNSGNMLVYILGAIFLLGLLIILVKGSFQEGTGIDADKVVLKATQVQQYASELERGVTYVLRNGVSESDLRFAATGASAIYGVYSDTSSMIFAPTGGGVEYKSPPTGINDGRKWGFYATTHFTDLGTDTAGSQKSELVAVLPNVTQAFCNQINRNVKQSIDLTQVTDPSALGCVFTSGEEFAGTYRAGAAVNLLDDTKVPVKPAKEACVRCNDGTFQYYRVLVVR
jgi:hypothetical protein